MFTSLLDHLRLVFGGDAPASPLTWGQIAARAAVVYLAGVILVRIGKSRLLSRATPLDIILAFILGSVLSRGITGSASLSGTIVATATLIALHYLFTALAYRSRWCGWLIKGSSYVLVSDGQIDWNNMRQSHITEADLREAMRLNANLEDLDKVQHAYKERSGEVSVVRKPCEPKIDVSVQDGIQTIRIELIQT